MPSSLDIGEGAHLNVVLPPTLETTQGQMNEFFTQLPFNCYLPEVASVEDLLKIFPWVASRVDGSPDPATPPEGRELG